MKITSGKLKSRKIATKVKGAKQPQYRPSASRTRYAIFNILQNANYLPEGYLQDAVVLDLYCGSGSFAFEAISHGAKMVLCVDESLEQIELVKFNAKHLGISEQIDTIRAKADQLPPSKQKFKIIYLDPPYGKNLVNSTLLSLIKGGWIGEHNLIVVEHEKHERIKDFKQLELLDHRVYGKTHLSIFTYRGANGQDSKE